MPTAKLKPDSARRHLQAFDFSNLFIQDIGWNFPTSEATQAYTVKEATFTTKPIAELSGFRVFEVTASNGTIPDAITQNEVCKQVTRHSAENLLIFLDAQRRTSLWLWMRREPSAEKGKSPKIRPRRHPYIKGQPGDLFLSKIAAMAVDLSELDAEGNIPITEAANRVRKALDIEAVTKVFFQDFKDQHGSFLQSIQGISDDGDRRWYASVILNRLMFIWFLQKKTFLDGGDLDYLPNLLDKSKKAGKNLFFAEVLRDLFFEGFAKPAAKRKVIGSVPLGNIPYLNGGLFLPHGIEATLEGDALFTGPFQKIKIKDEAFAGVFTLFGKYTWNLNDVPGADDREINPDVLGYIFEQYINQKEFGAYYTRPEITEYLCEQTIHQLVLDAANKFAADHANYLNKVQKKGVAAHTYETISDVLLQADGPLCRHLLKDVLPRLSLLDPACGSGAFLVAAMKTLLSLTTGLLGRAEAVQQTEILEWVKTEQKKHKAPLAYWIKKKIITKNIYGVDIMEEAVEIAKLRLFLALVASAEKRDQLEPLPNIEFNLLPGNSLIGLLHVDSTKFDSQSGAEKPSSGLQAKIVLNYQPKAPDLAMEINTTIAPNPKEKVGAFLATQRASKYGELLREKNRLVDLYKKAGDLVSGGDKQGEIRELTSLREKIEAANMAARGILNELLLKEFQGLGIQFEQATWDKAKKQEGKPDKRTLRISDIEALKPFHWAYEFDEIIVNRGGFDAIITNPPWEVFEKSDKEFLSKYDITIQKNKLRLEDWNNQRDDLLKDQEVRSLWLAYLSSYPHQAAWFKAAPQYRNQTSTIDGRIAASKNDFYKLFLEQCLNISRPKARCGIVIPGSIYNNKGATQLRKMLFEKTCLTGFFGFENKYGIFENVHRSFKFIVLTLETAGTTVNFPAAFLRHNVKDLASFPRNDDVWIQVESLHKLSPQTLSILEFQSEVDAQIVMKLYRHPILRPPNADHSFPSLHYELNLTNDHGLFESSPIKGTVPLIEGKNFHQFDHQWEPYRYWVREKAAREKLEATRRRVISNLIRNHELEIDPEDVVLDLGTDCFRVALRDIARNTDVRTMISTVLPKGVFCPHTVALERVFEPYVDAIGQLHPNNCPLDNKRRCLLVAILNSFSLDYIVRQQVTAHLSFFYVYNLPIPRLAVEDPIFRSLVERSARLIGTTAEFDGLIAEVFGSKSTHVSHGVKDPLSRQTLRAEIDALVARLYDLTEEEFTHILSTFPIVDESVKQQTINTYRDLVRLGMLPESRL